MDKKIKIAVSSPKIKLCVPEYNAVLCAECAKKADAAGADIIVFPELVLTGATAGDLFFQEALLKSAKLALGEYINATSSLKITSFLSLPLFDGLKIYNTVVAVSAGKILGITASGTETKQFSAISDSGITLDVLGSNVRVKKDTVYINERTRAKIFVKVGEDDVCMRGGIDVILNPVAVAEYIGLAKMRRNYAERISYELSAAFVIAGAGEGESGTDGIYASPRLVANKGEIIAEAKLFDENILYCEIDSLAERKEACDETEMCELCRFPFIPQDEKERRESCELAVDIQSRSLALRMERAYAKSLVIGVSGGLDSTLALLACVFAVDRLKKDRKDVIAITMPCFGTTERTKSNALALAEELGCTVRTIDIKAAVTQHFEDISHDSKNYDVVYENAQARERTQILMDVANAEGGIVVGTGDLSELALGFATYNGDHMSMYCVNGSVPKTLMRAIISHTADRARADGKTRLADILTDIVKTPVSPELLPVENGENKQHTENIIGPYELHDFFLYYTVKYGYSPDRISSLAASVFTEYKKADIDKYLGVFVRRFFSQQFKRSCLPDGPRVTEISLSPRGIWQMPSDVSYALWQGILSGEVKL